MVTDSAGRILRRLAVALCAEKLLEQLALITQSLTLWTFYWQMLERSAGAIVAANQFTDEM